MRTEPVIMDLRQHAATDPQHTAVVCGDERMSYAALEALANRIAAVWRQLGLVRGDHVAALIGNRPEALAAAWAAWRAGLYLTPMPSSLTAAELRYLIEDAQARCVLADAALDEIATPLPAMVASPVHWLSLRGNLAGYEPLEPRLAEVSPLPAANEMPGGLMMYTSGTTGAPKGVMRPLLPPTWRGTPPFAADLITLFELGGADVRYLSTAPLYHAAPLRCALAVTAGGGTVHIMQHFDAAQALELLQREHITHSQWVPTMFQRLLDLPEQTRSGFAAPAHRRAIHGAAPCPPALKAAMIEWWGPILLEYYSGSEGVGLTLIDSAEALQRPGSVGRARKGVLHIMNDQGRELPSGAVGLVCFSGTAPFTYHGAAREPAGHALPRDRQSFGDIGYVDAEGYLYLTDRQSDMIISGGVNLYPQEIEAVIRKAPGVWDCAVVGVPDQRFGERPEAFIVARRDVELDQHELANKVLRHCRKHLGRFKQPAHVHLIDRLPYSPTGKLLRRKLRELASAAR